MTNFGKWTAIALALCVAGTVWAADDAPKKKKRDGKKPAADRQRPGGHGDIFTKLDKNKDGSISKDEAPEKLWERLSKADKDGDNAVSKKEFAAAHQGGKRPGPDAVFGRFDKNKDNKLTAKEVPDQFWARISKADKDDDKAVSKQEFVAFAKAHGGPGGKGGHLKRLDKNEDGKITKEEAGKIWERLGKLDKNNDGAVSKEEIAAAHKDRAGDKPRKGRPDGKKKRPDKAE